MMAGDVTLVSQYGAMQLAMQAAVAEAFQTPDVIRMFARKEPGALRHRMVELEESKKLGRISSDAFK